MKIDFIIVGIWRNINITKIQQRNFFSRKAHLLVSLYDLWFIFLIINQLVKIRWKPRRKITIPELFHINKQKSST